MGPVPLTILILSIAIRGFLLWRGSVMAENRGRSPVGWGLASFFFGVWPLLILWGIGPAVPRVNFTPNN